MPLSRRTFSGNALALAFASALFDLNAAARAEFPVQKHRTTPTNSGMDSSTASTPSAPITKECAGRKCRPG